MTLKKVENNKLLLSLSTKIYGKKAVLNTSYLFTHKCHIHIDQLDENTIEIYFSGKEGQENLEITAKDFENELIDQQVRVDTENDYGHIRDEIVKQAFAPIDKKKEEKKSFD